jgi:hypothetical protein
MAGGPGWQTGNGLVYGVNADNVERVLGWLRALPNTARAGQADPS